MEVKEGLAYAVQTSHYKLLPEEGWPSGRRRQFAKLLIGLNRFVGSNPIPSSSLLGFLRVSRRYSLDPGIHSHFALWSRRGWWRAGLTPCPDFAALHAKPLHRCAP